MNMAQKIEEKIKGAVEIDSLEIINDSHKHQGHAGDDGSGETHFRVVIVSKAFAGLSRVAQQRMVMSAVKPLFDEELHAFSMKLSAP